MAICTFVSHWPQWINDDWYAIPTLSVCLVQTFGVHSLVATLSVAFGVAGDNEAYDR